MISSANLIKRQQLGYGDSAKAPTIFPATPFNDEKPCIGANKDQHSGYSHANPKGRVYQCVAVPRVYKVWSDSRGRSKSPYGW